jgi:TonB family protein
MGYQALLFCPDEKTARTVTQVLSELEFNVESCTEPFAAVKRLMGEHFDAVVVDCDNEQNATLLFKSARTSTSNQASLAVAVVEGQAGVAKAFRIGANLVLTKPINVEQAKGTLRVARGLLRKGEPAKPASSSDSTIAPVPKVAPTPPKIASPASPARPAAPVAASPVTSPRPVAPAAKPVAIPVRATSPATAASASPTPGTPAKDPIKIGTDGSASGSPVTAVPIPSTFNISAPASPSLTSGAASAPAPARIVPAPTIPDLKIEEAAPAPAAAFESVVEPSAEPVAIESSLSTAAVSAPAFTFGSVNAPTESTGSKKVLIGIAAALIVAGALYFGWTQLHGTPAQPVNSPKPTSPTPGNQSAPLATDATTSTISAAPGTSLSTVPSAKSPAQRSASPAIPAPATLADDSASPAADSLSSAKLSNTGAPKSPALKSTPAPLVVQGGSTPTVHTAAAAPDAPAPSMIGMAAPGSGGSLTNLVGTDSNTPAPVLQTMNVSQGVSQGLLIKKVQPSYPASALRLHLEGAVLLQATISKSGNISAVKVVSGDSILSKAAAEAVKQWKYKPYLLNGEPVEIQTQITINFKLPQ